MNRLKHAAVDIVVSAFIVFAATTGPAWTWWVLAVYTALMIVLKILALGTSGSIRRLTSGAESAPVLLLHMLYAVNVIALVLARWWLIAGGWALIWLLSILQNRRRA